MKILIFHVHAKRGINLLQVSQQVVDSPFSKLTQLMLEVVEQQNLPVPRALLKVSC
jgi:predicted amino acid-binding ACT domain protein